MSLDKNTILKINSEDNVHVEWQLQYKHTDIFIF